MLNPLNVKALLDAFNDGLFSPADIMERFGFVTIVQASCFVSYIQNQV